MHSEVESLSTQECWYLAYGSNLLPEKLARYVDDVSRPKVALSIKRRLYFAGKSSKWKGGVAFISVVDDNSASTHVLAYKVAGEELAGIFRGENGIGYGFPKDPSLLDIGVGEYRQILTMASDDKTRGKYNAVLRFPDMQGLPCYSFSTTRSLQQAKPDPEYLATIKEGLTRLASSFDVDAYLEEALQCPPSRSSGGQQGERTGDHLWFGRLELGASTGFPIVHLARNASPSKRATLYQAELTMDNASENIWVSFDLPNESAPSASPDLSQFIGEAQAVTEVRLRVLPLHPVRRLPGRTGDIPRSDVIQVSPSDSERLGKWALVCTPHYPAPMRLQARDDVCDGVVRFPYGARSLLALRPEDNVLLQQLPASGALARTRQWSRRVAERLVGAPAIALKVTEGLAGDDGDKIIRVDAWALDFLGVAAGGEVVVTWAKRSTRARILLQSDITRDAMNIQLAEATGKQSRATVTDVASRQQTPAHLRVWVSSTVRHALAIPPDTVVRVRRSVSHHLAGAASAAAVPLAGLGIAAMAIPNVPWPYWLLLVTLIVTLLWLPLRMKP